MLRNRVFLNGENYSATPIMIRVGDLALVAEAADETSLILELSTIDKICFDGSGGDKSSTWRTDLQRRFALEQHTGQKQAHKSRSGPAWPAAFRGHLRRRRGRASVVPLEASAAPPGAKASGMKAWRVETQSGAMRSTPARPDASRETQDH